MIYKILFLLGGLVFFSCASGKNFSYPEFKKPHAKKVIQKLEIPKEEEKKPNLDFLAYEDFPKFEILKVFPQNIPRRIYEIIFTTDGRFVVLIDRWNMTKLSLDTLREVKLLNHRQLVQGGFTGIGVSEDGERIIAGNSWTHKATLYTWNGEGLANFYCESSYFFVFDALISNKENQVLLLCYDFVNNKKEVRSFDQKGNLKWKKETKSLYLKELTELNKLITYEDNFLAIWNRAGNQEHTFLFHSNITTVGYAEEPQIFLLGNAHEWSVLRADHKKEALLNIQVQKELLSESYSLSPEYKSFYKIFRSGKFLISGGRNGAYLWSVRGELKQILKGHLQSVTAVNTNPEETLAITASSDRWIIWKRVD